MNLIRKFSKIAIIMLFLLISSFPVLGNVINNSIDDEKINYILNNNQWMILIGNNNTIINDEPVSIIEWGANTLESDHWTIMDSFISFIVDQDIWILNYRDEFQIYLNQGQIDLISAKLLNPYIDTNLQNQAIWYQNPEFLNQYTLAMSQTNGSFFEYIATFFDTYI